MNKRFIRLCIIAWCASSQINIPLSQSMKALSIDQVEAIEEFKQELSPISATAALEWKSNDTVKSFIEQVERTVQQTDPSLQALFKKQIKKLFQQVNIPIQFADHNFIERLSISEQIEPSKETITTQPAHKESLDQVIIEPAQASIHSKEFAQKTIYQRRQRPRTLAYWKKRVARKQCFKSKM